MSKNNKYIKELISRCHMVISEIVKAKEVEYIVQELVLTVVNYNIMRSMAHAY